jgi:hypothetical protein
MLSGRECHLALENQRIDASALMGGQMTLDSVLILPRINHTTVCVSVLLNRGQIGARYLDTCVLRTAVNCLVKRRVNYSKNISDVMVGVD